MNTCDRCGMTSRDVRMSLVNLAREAIHEGRRHTGPEYDHEYRCADRDACRARVRQSKENTA